MQERLQLSSKGWILEDVFVGRGPGGFFRMQGVCRSGLLPSLSIAGSTRLQRPQIIIAKRTEGSIDMIDAVMVDDGLLIPKSLLTKLGTEDLEVLTRGREIVIRPKSKIQQYCGFVGETDYDEEFIKELERDFEESGDI
jgi:virulence-associated protein VagC